MCRISIIIPIYNVEKFLKKCLTSVIQQSYEDFECILIDDGSTDSSSAICDKFVSMDNRFQVIHQENRGVSVARNAGLNVAKGQIITFVDADDWIDIDYCKTIVINMQDVDLCYFQANHHYIDQSQQISIPPMLGYYEKGAISTVCRSMLENKVNYEFFGYTWNKAFKMNIIKENSILFSDSISMREDELFTMQYVTHINNLLILPNVLYNYRVTENGLTIQKNTSKEYLLLAQYEKLLIRDYENIFGNIIYEKILGYLTDAAIFEKSIILSVKYYIQAYRYSKEFEQRCYSRRRERFLFQKFGFGGILPFVFLRIKLCVK